LENTAWFILEYTQQHRNIGSKYPQREALKELFEVIGDHERWKGEIGFDAFAQTYLRKTIAERRRLRADIARAEQINAAWERLRKTARKTPREYRGPGEGRRKYGPDQAEELEEPHAGWERVLINSKRRKGGK
jgi:hypothetical protein